MTDVPPAHARPTPQGLAFLELGERLRQRGQLAAAASVTQAGLSHFPETADAHDLMGRILADQGDDAGASGAWHAALECDADHLGARKGLAFLAFRTGDLGAAERHLELAALRAPRDPAVLAALDRVRSAQDRRPVTETPAVNDPGSGVLLFDHQGMRLAGMVTAENDEALADAAAALGAGVSREADRLVRLLDLGTLQHVMLESPDARIAVVPVSDDVSLLLHRAVAIPVGRLLALAGRAAHGARQWLEQLR